jgi:Fe-S cluster biogenesis protein NfuA
MTMKMGLERRLKERIPEIAEVVQALPGAPELNDENIEVVLDGVRPFLSVAGGTISLESLTGTVYMSIYAVMCIQMYVWMTVCMYACMYEQTYKTRCMYACFHADLHRHI